jgi:hypothetical protein
MLLYLVGRFLLHNLVRDNSRLVHFFYCLIALRQYAPHAISIARLRDIRAILLQ